MTSSMNPHPRGVDDSRPPETVDRLLVGICGAIWLVWLVVFVIATVACVNLGRAGGGGSGDTGDSPWLLYSIIGVSGLTILAAIPLLLRARRDAFADRSGTSQPTAAPLPAADEAGALPVRPAPVADAPTEKIQIFGTAVDPVRGQSNSGEHHRHERESVSLRTDAVEREWLRGTAVSYTHLTLPTILLV